jgi:hypothetical protein
MRRHLGIALVLMAVAPYIAFAEEPPLPRPEPAPAAQAPSSPDFFFKPPRGSFSIRASFDFLNGGSDWFDFVEKQLTLSRSDFQTVGVAGDVNIRLRPRFDIVIGGDYMAEATDSEYRDFVDNQRQPIQQTTRIRDGSITGGVRYALRERGRAVSSLAWIPARLVPYVGGGGGILIYDLVQYGDFVDFTNFAVFGDSLPSNGATPLLYADGGVDLQLVKRVFVSVDVRYKWASPELDKSVWTGFEPLDLGGLRLSTGIAVTF